MDFNFFHFDCFKFIASVFYHTPHANGIKYILLYFLNFLEYMLVEVFNMKKNSLSIRVPFIPGFDRDLLNRLKVILAVISCSREVNIMAFKAYCEETAKIYARKYNWYYMPPSAHVILIHGWRIMQQLLVPISMLSEEAQEANNKNVKNFRLNFARKTSM